jgi:hypothetical protein
MTLAELYEKTLQKIGLIAANEAAEPEDVALVAARYVGLYNLLNGLDLVSWAQSAAIPDQFEIPLVTMLACHCASEFRVPPADYQKLLAEGGVALPQTSWAERQLRLLIAKDYVPTRAQSEYF